MQGVSDGHMQGVSDVHMQGVVDDGTGKDSEYFRPKRQTVDGHLQTETFHDIPRQHYGPYWDILQCYQDMIINFDGLGGPGEYFLTFECFCLSMSKNEKMPQVYTT